MKKEKLHSFKNYFKGYFRWNSLWVIISFVTVLLSLAAVLSITFMMNNRFNTAIDHTTQVNSSQIVDNVSVGIDNYILNMIQISQIVTDIVKENPEQASFQDNTYFLLRDDVDTIAVFDNEGYLKVKTDNRPLRTSGELIKQDWFRAVASGSQNFSLSSPHVQRLYPSQYRWVISLSAGLSWESEGKKQLGIVLVDLNFNSIREMCSKELGENGYIYILGANDQIVYHPLQQMIYAGIQHEDIQMVADMQDGSSIVNTENNRMLVTVKSLKNADWRVVGVSPLNGVLSYDEDMMLFLTLVVAAILLIVILLATSVSLSITRPLRRLMSLMKQVESGKWNVSYEDKGVYEVQALSKSFNHMVARIKKLMEQVLQEQKMLRRSEIKTLNAQINPHFLYNTLGSMVWLAESGDRENVVKMIDALAKFFRLSLSGGKDFIPVEDELQHVENYLIIQKMRFNEQFDYNIEKAAGVENCQTMKMVLQPIVENAIVHGVGHSQDAGHITIRAYAEEERLIYEVQDNGYGMTPETLKSIFEKEPSAESGIGIQNVQQRIQLVYGGEYGLFYESELDMGTKVKIVLAANPEGGDGR